MDAAILYIIICNFVATLILVIKVRRAEKKLHDIDEHLDLLHDRVDTIGKEIGKMWLAGKNAGKRGGGE
jgi:hypothetical protein